MIAVSFARASSGGRILLAAVIATALAGSAGGALAQTPSDTIPAAPVGHYQPRRVQVPTNARVQENSELSSERDFDQQLRICRAC
jgi:hypothetical protein